MKLKVWKLKTYKRKYMGTQRITSNWIQELKPNEIFVFGSNLEGKHGGGAALLAYRKWGAVWGQGAGLQGQTYGIPTTKAHPEYIFLVTEIGCGIAGFKPAEIAPLFQDAIPVGNIYLPERFWQILNA